GGGIFLEESSPALSRLMIRGNNANVGGGISAAESSSMISQTQIMGNTAKGKGFFTTDTGAGVYIGSGSSHIMQFKNVLISGNMALSMGGGIHVHMGDPIRVELINVTIVGNWAEEGAGINYLWTGVNSIKIINSVIWGNPGETNSNYFYDNEVIEGAHNLIEGRDPHQEIGGVPFTGTAADLFISFDPASEGNPSLQGDYQLSDSSPLIDAGNITDYEEATNSSLSGDEMDLAGNPRVYDFAAGGII